ncbi:HalOD1 output domain-containing protein [Halomicrococcus sp. SG-WS-1]|uniref:HalOD1 output domain-containing protein n=1 Tax=Halomicrococcus sp. SG-WS-1 TaxID=3439057 RepID=UPI003F78E8C5
MSGDGERPGEEPTGRDELPDASPADYDWAVTSPVAAVTELVADATDRDPATLDPLYDYVDPDALNALVTSSNDDQAPRVRITLMYAGYEVTLRRDGHVRLRGQR